MNIEFEYLYRDCGNFKNYGRAVFANKGNLSAKDIHEKILSVLVPEPFFRAADIGLPDLYFKDFPYDPELDHELHEYYRVSGTKEPTNDSADKDITDLMLAIEEKCWGW
ncbi:MAG: hypothetical protein ACLPN2_08445 [Terriglobales bacterium]